jgi:hypothetical protein
MQQLQHLRLNRWQQCLSDLGSQVPRQRNTTLQISSRGLQLDCSRHLQRVTPFPLPNPPLTFTRPKPSAPTKPSPSATQNGATSSPTKNGSDSNTASTSNSTATTGSLRPPAGVLESVTSKKSTPAYLTTSTISPPAAPTSTPPSTA